MSIDIVFPTQMQFCHLTKEISLFLLSNLVHKKVNLDYKKI